jgi:type IV pilus assembly protein PilB
MNNRSQNIGKTSLIGTDSIEYTDELCASAILLRASDIHLDISEFGAVVTLRIGTNLSHQTSISHEIARSIVGRIKVLAKLRLDINDKSQDGSFTFRGADTKAYIRVSTAPTVFGENVVCRIFSNSIDLFDLRHIGLQEEELSILKDALHKDSGLILVSGPTGSGKTTTLYACLRHLVSTSKVIVTLEDPVEVIIPSIRQIIVHQEHGFGFSNALRSVLRQDPDIIMVGEIRDRETAELAIQAALTGHLVLATIHAVSALGIIDRLNSMGVKSDACAQVINLLISQRKITLKDAGNAKVVFEIVDFNQKFKSNLIFTTGAGSGSLAQTMREEGVMLLKDRVEGLFHEGLISRDEMNKYMR